MHKVVTRKLIAAILILQLKSLQGHIYRSSLPCLTFYLMSACSYIKPGDGYSGTDEPSLICFTNCLKFLTCVSR